MLAAYFRVSVTDLALLFMDTDVLALRQIPDPLRFILADPYVVMLFHLLS